MKHRAFLGLIIGLVLFATVLATHNMTAVASSFGAAGWHLAWVVIWRILSIFASGAAWWCLFQAIERPFYLCLVLGRWIAEAINHLLPALQIGGDVVRARLAYLMAKHQGLPLSGVKTATVQVIDITCALTAQITLVTIGFLVLSARGLVALPYTVLGIAVAFLPLIGLLMVQRREVLQGAGGLLAKLGLHRFLQEIAETTGDLASQFRALYQQQSVVFSAYVWHVCAGILRIGETWSALWMFGHPVSLTDAMLIDVMAGAARSLAFFIPGALGVQENGILLISHLLGIDPSLALAVALSKRARDIILGLPGLGAWLITERRLPVIGSLSEGNR